MEWAQPLSTARTLLTLHFLPTTPPHPLSNFTWEIIVVDDGSKDGTAALVLSQYVTKHGADKVRLLKSAANGGKGAAVRKGMMRARGKWLLMADADGATQFSALDDLLAAAKGVATAGRAPRAFALGSRAHLKKARSPLRQLLSRGFHAVISLLLGGQSIQDTQCGFKLLTRAAARQLFGALHIERWAFDVELVYLAGLFGVPAVEVPVAWHEVGGSKLDPTSASVSRGGGGGGRAAEGLSRGGEAAGHWLSLTISHARTHTPRTHACHRLRCCGTLLSFAWHTWLACGRSQCDGRRGLWDRGVPSGRKVGLG